MTWPGAMAWAAIPLGGMPLVALPVLVPLATALLLLVRPRAMTVWLPLAGAALTLAASLALAWLQPADRLAAFAAPLAGCVGMAMALAQPAWVAREIDGFRLAAVHVPRALATAQILLAGVMVAILAPDPAVGWLGLVGMALALLLPLALAGEPAVRLRGRALLHVAAIGLVVSLLGAVALVMPGGGWRAAARADGALGWLGLACMLLGAATCGALALLAGRENAVPAGGLSGFAVVLAVMVMALRLPMPVPMPVPVPMQVLGFMMVLSGAVWAARAVAVRDWVDATVLTQAGMVLVAAGLGTPAGRFAALAQLGFLVLARVAATAGAPGLLSLAGLPPFGLFAGLFLVAAAIAAVSIPLAVVLAIAVLVPVWRLPGLMPAFAWPGWRDLPGWAVLALGAVLGLAMPQAVSAWIGRVAMDWP